MTLQSVHHIYIVCTVSFITDSDLGFLDLCGMLPEVYFSFYKLTKQIHLVSVSPNYAR